MRKLLYIPVLSFLLLAYGGYGQNAGYTYAGKMSPDAIPHNELWVSPFAGLVLAGDEGAAVPVRVLFNHNLGKRIGYHGQFTYAKSDLSRGDDDDIKPQGGWANVVLLDLNVYWNVKTRVIAENPFSSESVPAYSSGWDDPRSGKNSSSKFTSHKIGAGISYLNYPVLLTNGIIINEKDNPRKSYILGSDWQLGDSYLEYGVSNAYTAYALNLAYRISTGSRLEYKQLSNIPIKHSFNPMTHELTFQLMYALKQEIVDMVSPEGVVYVVEEGSSSFRPFGLTGEWRYPIMSKLGLGIKFGVLPTIGGNGGFLNVAGYVIL